MGEAVSITDISSLNVPLKMETNIEIISANDSQINKPHDDINSFLAQIENSDKDDKKKEVQITKKSEKVKREIIRPPQEEVEEKRRLRKERKKQGQNEKPKNPNQSDNKKARAQLRVEETDSEPNLPQSEKKCLGWRYAKLQKSFEYLATVQDAGHIFSDPKAVKELKNITESVASANQNHQLESIMVAFEHNFTKVLTDLIAFMNTKVVEALTGESTPEKERRRTLLIAHNSLQTARFYANYSNRFCSEFHELNGIEVVFRYLTSEILISKYIELAGWPKTESFIHVNRLVRGSIGLLINLSRQFNDFSTKWKECGATKIILALTERIKSIEDNQISMYILLSSIASDIEIDEFISDIHPVISQIVTIIGRIAAAIETGQNLERVNFQFGQETHEVCRISLSRAWNLGELLNALYHLAVNDKLKAQIYSKYEMKAHISKIVFNGNEFEQRCALQLLWQLCFDSEVLNDVLADLEMFGRIEEYSVDARPEFGSCKKICKGILWLAKPDEVKRSDERSEKHLMISYNKFSRELCKDIKQHLEKGGYKVWIDTENIHGK